MDLRRIIAAVGVTSALVAAGALALRRSEPAAIAQTAQTAPALPRAEIAIVATPHDADARASEVRLVSIDGDAKPARIATLATIAHAPGAVLRGDVVRDARGERVLVIAADDERDRAKLDWGSTLWRVGGGAGGAVTELARGLYHASRPLASSDGAVYVERGAAGAWPSAAEAKAGTLRVDAIAIDAIDPTSGASRTVYAANAYTLHLCGEHEAELVVYRVDPRGADLLAIDRGSGKSRLVTTLAPFARDFSIDATHGARGSVVMSNRDERDSHLWIIARVDLATGRAVRLAEQRDDAPAPFAIPGGALAWTTSARRGLSVSTNAVAGAASKSIAPLGAGFDAVTNASTDGAWITIAHVPLAASAYDAFAAVHVASGTPVRLATKDERVEVLGFVGGTNGGAR